ncbi:MAG TPA: 1,4-alpha-glucan branching protein domain-containing protein [Verrucomicrobiae bacterium]|nr:1,4-alpha-glucan branching protein domain-containing protein [Verrucomicrobiae bacterium]
MEKGYLALVLHAHLPFVRHPESEDYLEERWLYEAITETYIPLLQVFEGLVKDGVDFRITISITPTLLSMLTDNLLQERYCKHIDLLVELAEREEIRTAGSPDFNRLAQGYTARFKSIKEFYLKHACNLVEPFRQLQLAGKLEIITSAATHAFLPLVLTEEAVRAQIKTAISLYTQHFGVPPKGFWLPECGFAPALDQILAECGISYFFTDSHGVESTNPQPVFGTMSPVLTPHGVAAFARDEECSKQVWSSGEGYPGDYDYREYYRDIGFDLDFKLVKKYIHPKGIRINTGIKYFRITGKGEHKEPYNIDRGLEKAALHAGDFLWKRQRQVEHWAWHMGRKPVIVAPYDAELFGHWWHEGPAWIDMLLRKMHYDQEMIKTITPSEYLALYSDYQVCRLAMSSWGRGGYADVWLRGENDWIYPALHWAEQRMVQLANKWGEPSQLERRALNQMARELMLAQSSDWAFTMDSKTMVDYAVKRTKYHMNHFARLHEMLSTKEVHEQYLAKLEGLDNIFADLDYCVYRSGYPVNYYARKKPGPPRVLILSWEFPPMVVGGLSRHVYDLSRYLVRQGWEVHVVTTEIGEYPHYEVVEGVHVHRVHVLKPDGGDFIHWAFQLNLMMLDACQALLNSGLTFDLVHGHDWLCCYAAKTLKEEYDIPLVATIHATEYGRNNGIFTDLQRYIHGLEWKLTYEACRVIVCSNYMGREAQEVFQLPADKLDVIPNGVDPEVLKAQPRSITGKGAYALESERIVLFIGRLVREKGVQTLLEAAPMILAEQPEVKFVISGKGPAMEELKNYAGCLGIGEKVLFTGYVTDEQRNNLFNLAEVAVFPSLYEPFGIVALEAMAVHTPVIVSDVGGLADVIQHGQNGLKMYPGDAYSLAKQVKDLLRDPNWADSLADQALADLNKYNWNKIAEKTLDVYTKALNKKESACAIQQIAVGLKTNSIGLSFKA